MRGLNPAQNFVLPVQKTLIVDRSTTRLSVYCGADWFQLPDFLVGQVRLVRIAPRL
jgi:hypothetical protein